MQRSTAEKLRLEWVDELCHHMMFDREYIGGAETGNYVCLICGKAFDIKRIQLLILLPFILAGAPVAELIEIIQAFLETF
jgi:hypothetical protein